MIFPEICKFTIVSSNDVEWKYHFKRYTNFTVSSNNNDIRQNDILSVRLAASSRSRRKVAALLGSGPGLRFQFFGPRVFRVFRIRQWSQACESVTESYRMKYCERVRYSESSLLLPNKPNGIYLSVCCVA